MAGPDNETGPVSDIPGVMELTYQPDHTAAPRFWGECTATYDTQAPAVRKRYQGRGQGRLALVSRGSA